MPSVFLNPSYPLVHVKISLHEMHLLQHSFWNNAGNVVKNVELKLRVHHNHQGIVSLETAKSNDIAKYHNVKLWERFL